MIAQKKVAEIRATGHVAVILASSLGAIAIIRALGKARIPVIVIGLNYHHKSIYTTVALKAETKRDVENILFLLPLLLNMKPVLFTDADDYLEIILANWNRLEKNYYIPASENNYKLINKERIEEIVDIHNVSALPVAFHKVSDIEKQHYPVIIKPLSNGDGYKALKEKPKKAYICNNEIETMDVDIYLKELNVGYVIQQVIDGEANTNYSVLLYRNAQGKVEVGFTVRKLRIYPLNFGVSAAVISENNPEIINQSIAIMELIDFQGIGEFEYKFCRETNTYILLEVNGRFPLQTNVLNQSNPHFISTVFHDLMNNSTSDVVSNKSVSNITWIFLLNDIRAIIAEYGKSTLKLNLITSLTSRVQSAIWSISDPLPTIYFLKYISDKLYRKRHDKNLYSKMKSRKKKYYNRTSSEK